MVKGQPKLNVTVTPATAKSPERRAQPLPAPETKSRKVTSREMFGNLRGLAEGWSPSVERALSPPEELFYMSSDMTGARYFSAEPSFAIADFMKSLRSNVPARPNTKYGVVVYETAGSVYFVLADSGRRIAVRALLQNYHDSISRKSWEDVKSAIKNAEAAAAANPGKVAFHDGAISLL